MDSPRNIFNFKNLPYPSQDRSWWQKPRHTLLGVALERFRPGSTHDEALPCVGITPTKLTAVPLAAIFNNLRQEMKKLTITLITLICFGCGNSSDIRQIGYRNDLTVSDISGNPTGKESFYFDPIVFRDTFPIPNWVVEPPYDTIDDFNRVPKGKIKVEFEIMTDSLSLKWFSEVLAKNKEPILSNYYLGKDIYRLTWLRSFDQGVIIKIIKEQNDYIVETKWLDWADQKAHSSTKKITVDIVAGLENLLNEHKFYYTESYDWELPGNDGSDWILEVHTADRYHFLYKWSPDIGHSNGLREIGEFIIKNSDAKEEEIY